MPDLEREHNTIESFCDRITELSGVQTKVIGWPDEENPGQGHCDALMVRDSEQISLDHRLIESFINHYKDNALLKSVVAPLQNSLDGLYPDHCIRISIRVRGLPKGSRDKMREELEKGCIDILKEVPEDSRIHKYDIVGVPCEIGVSKTPSKNSGCFVKRVLPKDQETELTDGLLQALKSKSKQFDRFKANGLYTILLFDTDDFSSLDEHMIADAFSIAIGQCDITLMDEIYLHYKYPDDFVIVPLKIGKNIYPNLKEFDEYYEKQYSTI